MLNAEDLLLLLTADDTGKLAADGTNTDLALGGGYWPSWHSCSWSTLRAPTSGGEKAD